MARKNLNYKGFITERFIVKKFSTKFITQKYLSWFGDKNISKFIKFKPNNIYELKKNVKDTVNKKNTFFFAIFDKKKHIGNFKIHDVNYKKNLAWFGILIGDKNYRGKSVSTEIIEHCKIFLLKKKIFYLKLNVDKNNIAALKSYKKSGFILDKENKKFITMTCKIYLKKIILGLAQLQSIYGVTNKTKKKLTVSDSIKILKIFDNSQINELDSAMNYPFDIKLLNKLKKKIFFNTKILTSDFKNFKNINKYLDSINSIKNIQVNTLFIHDGNNLTDKNKSSIFKKILLLKKQKKINKVGISIHNFSNLKKLLHKFKFDVIQIPFSVVDNRVKKYLPLLKSKNIEIHARSIFLQGALLNQIKTNAKLSKIYNKIIFKRNIDRITFLLSYVLNEINIDKILIGVRQTNQLKMILKLSNLKLTNLKYKNLDSTDPEIINPLKWKELNYHETK